MSTKTRHVKKNIKEDQLVTVAVRFSQWAQEHFTQVIVGVAALVVAVIVVVLTASGRQGASREAERLLGSGMTLMQQGDYAAARGTFQQVRERFGGRHAAAAQFFEAESLLRQGNFFEALAGFDAYLQRAGDYPVFRASAIAGKATCHEGLGDPKLAAETLVELLEVLDESDPRYLDNALQAGELFASAGDKDRAATYFRLVYDKGSGNLKDRASVALAILGS
jgi:tetratricopeptide (TPR) repeat protein